MRVLAALLALCLATIAHAEPDADVFKHPAAGRVLLESVLFEPTKNLRDTQVLQGQFAHKKYLSEVPKPLSASGEFTFARDLGVYWHTQKPFDSVFVLTRQGLVQRDAGSETLRLSADEQPAVRIIANIFLALFTLDLTALDASFNLSGVKHEGTWTIGLRPKSNAIANVFQEALVSGGKEVETIVLVDKHGDRTVIELQSVTHGSGAPSDAVRALFKR